MHIKQAMTSAAIIAQSRSCWYWKCLRALLLLTSNATRSTIKHYASLDIAKKRCPGFHMHVDVCDNLTSLAHGRCFYMDIASLRCIHVALAPQAYPASWRHHNLVPPRLYNGMTCCVGTILELIVNITNICVIVPKVEVK